MRTINNPTKIPNANHKSTIENKPIILVLHPVILQLKIITSGSPGRRLRIIFNGLANIVNRIKKTSKKNSKIPESDVISTPSLVRKNKINITIATNAHFIPHTKHSGFFLSAN